jgi:thiamine kinase-like enzyme
MEFTEVEALARRIPQLATAKEIGISFLAGGITNCNYRLVANGEELVLRVPGTRSDILGIVRTAEAHNHCVAANAGVAPEVIGFIMPEGCLVTRFVQGEKVAQDKMHTPKLIREVCHSLQAIHNGSDFSGSFSPFRTVESYLSIGRVNNVRLPGDIGYFERVSREMEQTLCEDRTFRPRPIHADLLNDNLIDDGKVIRILDWEYSGMGDIFFDLGNLADHHNFNDADEQRLLKEYFGEVTARDAARLKLMRIMSEFREAMWGVVQGIVSNIEYDFDGYAKEFFERMRRRASHRGYLDWLRAAAEAPQKRAVESM